MWSERGDAKSWPANGARGALRLALVNHPPEDYPLPRWLCNPHGIRRMPFSNQKYLLRLFSDERSICRRRLRAREAKAGTFPSRLLISCCVACLQWREIVFAPPHLPPTLPGFSALCIFITHRGKIKMDELTSLRVIKLQRRRKSGASALQACFFFCACLTNRHDNVTAEV